MPKEKQGGDIRKQRLAKALKANLARRKAQAKQRVQPEPPDPPQKD